ncbi:MAG TPA: hypothetical protein VGR28_11915, partial [Candidatus Thermoplasmatota archaeon]|nr:hypothetical protein [Candidatus Thermoplasmatota archaeon]
YRFTNRTAFGDVVEVLEGNVGELKASGGNRTLRFLDDRNDSLLNVNDAWVARVDMDLVLTVSRQGSILGTSQGCVR